MASVPGTEPEPADADQVESDHGSSSRRHEIDERLSEREKLRISRFDVVTSFFMALILFIGVFVFMLFVIWLTSRWTFPPRPLQPIIEEPAGRGENPEGFERDFEPPGAEEVEELQEPTLQDTIEAVTDAVSTVAASLVTTDTAATATTAGTGAGDSRPPGPPGEGADIIPRFERWQLDFTAKDINTYAKQLEFFKIEPAAIGGSVQGVDAAKNLVARPTKYRIVDTQAEKRLYFMWNSPSPLMQYDRQLLQQAGVQLGNRQIMKFIPKELENVTLANLELDYARSKGYQQVTQIAKTVFACKPEGGGYKFEVTSQRYRKGK